MSLWLVVNSQRLSPDGWWAWSSWWVSWAWAAALMSVLRFLVSGFRGLLAGCLDLGGLDRLAGLVAPGIARVGDHARELAVGEPREGGHRRALLAVQDQRELGGLRAVDHLGAVERREGGRHALAGGLVAGHAVGRVDLLADGLELVERPLLVGVLGGGGRGRDCAGRRRSRGGRDDLRRLRLLLLHPRGVLLG